MRRWIAASSVVLFFCSLAFGGYYGGSTQNHGHTSTPGDGGRLSNLSVTTKVSVGRSTMTDAGIQVSSVSAPIVVTSTLTLANKFDFAGGLYKRPRILFSANYSITVETNTRTNNTTGILFEDGEYRTVTEDNMTASVYRTLKIDRLGYWASSSTIQSGVYGSTMTHNTWLAVYAVKVSSAGLADKFVLIGTTITHQPNNTLALTNAFGSGAYCYLGLIRSGHNSTLYPRPYLVEFAQNDAYTIFTSTVINNGNIYTGIQLAQTASGTSLTYTYASGMTGTGLPDTISLVTFIHTCASSGAGVDIQTQIGSNVRYFRTGATVGASSLFISGVQPQLGLVTNTASATGQDIGLQGFFDSGLK